MRAGNNNHKQKITTAGYRPPRNDAKRTNPKR